MGVQTRSALKTTNRDFNNILDSVQTQKDHLRHEGTVPTLTVTTAGDGSCTISASSTDVAGEVTFADTWADGDTFQCYFVNDGDQTDTIAAGSGVTLGDSGNTILENEACLLVFRRTSSTAVTVYQIGG